MQNLETYRERIADRLLAGRWIKPDEKGIMADIVVLFLMREVCAKNFFSKIEKTFV